MCCKVLTLQNEIKYCKNNTNKYNSTGGPAHYYVNNNCLYCKCNKTTNISVISYFTSNVVNYYNG